VLVGSDLGRQRSIVEIFGPDADDDRLPDVALESGSLLEHRVVERDLLTTDQDDWTPVAVDDVAVEEVHRRRADERSDEDVVGSVIERLGLVDLLELARLQNHHTVAHRHGLDLVVGDIDGGDTEGALDPGDLGTHLDAELGVEVRQRLVHQECSRLADDRPAHGDALALAARELTWLAAEVLLELEDLRSLVDPSVDLVLGNLAELEGEPDVVVDGHVGVQRVVLEHHRDVAIARGYVVDDPIADSQRAAGDLLEPGDHPQGGRLPATRRADEHQELAFVDLQVESVDRLEPVRVDLVDALERDAGHCPLLSVRAAAHAPGVTTVAHIAGLEPVPVSSLSAAHVCR